MSDHDDFEERFLRANANANYLGYELANLVRRLMRASKNGDGGHQKYEAAEALRHFLQLARRAEEISIRNVIDEAAECLSVDVDYDDLDYLDVSLAQDATRYLLEKSSSDAFAAGRASKSWDRFLKSMKHYDDNRRSRLERSREKWD